MFHLNGLNCCGIVEITSRRPFPSEKDFLHAITGEALLLATTTPSQKAYISFLKKVGFKRKRTFRNGNSGNLVTVWFFYLKEKKNG